MGVQKAHTAAALSDSFAPAFDSTQPPAAAKQQALSGPEIWHRQLLSCWRHLRQLSVKQPATRRRLLPPPFHCLKPASPHTPVLHQIAGLLTAPRQKKGRGKKNTNCLKPDVSLFTFFIISSCHNFCFSSRFLTQSCF